MIRRLGFIVLATALIVADCGRQVTPNRTSTSSSAGFMTVKFIVKAPFAFNTYSYAVVFNTQTFPNSPAGTPTWPQQSGANINYPGYSFMIVVTSIGGASYSATPYVFQRPNFNNTGAPTLLQVPYVQQQLPQPILDTTGTQLTITFDRGLAAFFATPQPSATATPTGTPTPTPTPTATATGSPSPTPGASISPGNLSPNWYFNFFVVQGAITSQIGTGSGAATILSNLGNGGGNDNSWSLGNYPNGLPVLTSFDTGTFYALAQFNPQADAATIVSGEISNVP